MCCHIYYTNVLVLSSSLYQLSELVKTLATLALLAPVTLLRKVLYERIDTEVCTKLTLCYAILLSLSEQKCNELACALTAEGKLYCRKNDTCQELIELLSSKLCAEAETERVNTSLQHLQCGCISLLRTLYGYSLMCKPAVVAAYASQIRELTSLSTQRLKTFKVLSTVVWTKIKTLVCTPYQLALIIGTFEVHSYRSLPSLGRDARKLSE